MKIENKFITIDNTKEKTQYILKVKNIQNKTDKHIKSFILSYFRNISYHQNKRAAQQASGIKINEKHKEFTFDNVQIDSFNTLIDSKADINAAIIKEILFAVKRLLDTLENYNLGILYFDLDDFIIITSGGEIGSKTYALMALFVGFEKLISLRQKSAEILIPFKKGKFLAPEVRDITSLPAEIIEPTKAAYYSLGELAVFLVSKKCNFKTIGEFKEALSPLLNTKIYWMILRCLEKDPNDRYLLYI